MKITYLYILSVAVLLGACTTEDDLISERIADNPPAAAPVYDAGDADFSTYVSVGNSLTAGLMDAALYTSGQNASFPNLLAGSFAQVGGGAFVQPDIESENGFNTSLNDLSSAFDPAAAIFGKFILDTSIPGPTPNPGGADPLNMVSDRAAVNNLGVPGMRLLELSVNGYGTLNPFYTRFALDPSATSVLEQAIAKQPTFMTFWLGSNEVLPWASAGGTGATGLAADGTTADPSGDASTGSLVSVSSFQSALTGNLTALFTANPSLQMAMLNIPNITVLPFFQAVSYNAIPLDAETAAAAQAGYDGYNAILDALANPALGALALSADEIAARKVTFAEGQNAVVVVDDQLTDISTALATLQALGQVTAAQVAALTPLAQARQLKSATDDPNLAQFGLPAEILTLSAATVLGTLAVPDNPASVIGVGVPLGDQYTLTTDEIGLLLVRIGTFNAIIEATANANTSIALVDAFTIISNAAANGGVTVDGVTLSPDFAPNGIYSTDGIHPNPRGHGIVANAIIDAINENWNASLPSVDVLALRSVIFQ